MSVSDIFVAISQYNALLNSEIIRKPGTMVTHIGTILGEYPIANIGKHQLDNIGPISVCYSGCHPQMSKLLHRASPLCQRG